MSISTPLEPEVVVLQTGHATLHTDERTLINDIRAKVHEPIDLKSVSGTKAVLWSEGAVKDYTLVGNTIFQFPFDNLPEGGHTGQATQIVMRLRQDATGNRSATFQSVLWAGGAAPTLTTAGSRVDWLTFITLDGGISWTGFLAAKDVR